MLGIIVKIWCAPFTRVNANNQLWAMTLRKWRGKEALPKPTIKRDSSKKKFCDPEKASNAVKMELAVGRIAEACGLQHLLPKVSVASVKGVMPETGHPVDWDGLFMTEAPGISVYSAAYWDVKPSIIEEVLMRRVNSSQVVEAAIFDLLTSQCDRHSNNIFIDEQGGLTLIDNGDALGHQDMCPEGFSLNSLFLPSTPEHTYKAVGKKFAQTGS
ncbi:hypothetical protein BSKO_03183 [Bryopsis sp. KO-2023]|nr:hypothetical protein BSKO_03183 [Bryopsis sp. KO-2023]